MIRLKTNVLLSRPKPVFENNPEIGFVSAFYSKQDKPLTLWEKFDGPGNIRRAEEDEASIQLIGPSTASERVKLSTPIRPFTTLGIKLPYMVIALKFINRACGFDVQIEDNQRIRRRFQFWTKFSTTRRRPFTTLIPLYLHQGWNEIFLDLPAITKKLYGTDYVETVRIQVYPSCRLRMIYFARIPMHMSRALAIMGILLEEGKNAVDLQKLVKPDGENVGAALLPDDVAANQNQPAATPAPATAAAVDNNDKKSDEKGQSPICPSAQAPTPDAGNGNETKPLPTAQASTPNAGNGNETKPNVPDTIHNQATSNSKPVKEQSRGETASSPQLSRKSKEEHTTNGTTDQTPHAATALAVVGHPAISLASITGGARKVAIKPFKLTLLQEYRNQLEVLSKTGSQGLNQVVRDVPVPASAREANESTIPVDSLSKGSERERKPEICPGVNSVPTPSPSRSKPTSSSSIGNANGNGNVNGNEPAPADPGNPLSSVKDECQSQERPPSPPPLTPPTPPANHRLTFMQLRKDSLGTINNHNQGKHLQNSDPKS